MTQADKYKAILAHHLPEGAAEKIYELGSSKGVQLSIVGPRKSKLGDYKAPAGNNERHTITINGNLNRYFFLYVLLHELAHLLTFEDYGRRVAPHGHEWQKRYALLLQDYIAFFPSDVASLLAQYVAHIPLKQAVGKEIENTLRHYDADYDPSQKTLADLPIGSLFRLPSQPNMIFRSLEKRRTRYKCEEVRTGNLFLVTETAPIETVKERFR